MNDDDEIKDAHFVLMDGYVETSYGDILADSAFDKCLAYLEDDFAASKDAKVWLYRGDIDIAGNLGLDVDMYGDDNLWGAFEEAATVVIDGNLNVDGAIINVSPDFGVRLLVNGNVKAKAMILGGAQTLIAGDIDLCGGVGMAHYNDGEHLSPGAVKNASLIINHSNYFPGSTPEGLLVLAWRGRLESYEVDAKARLAPELLDGDFPVPEKIMHRILTGALLLQ